MMKSRSREESMKPKVDNNCDPSAFDQLKNVAVDLLKQDGRQSIREQVIHDKFQDISAGLHCLWMVLCSSPATDKG